MLYLLRFLYKEKLGEWNFEGNTGRGLLEIKIMKNVNRF